MIVTVNGKQLDLTPALKSYAEEKVRKFERYLSNITEAVVTLSVQKYVHKAEILLKVNGFLIQAEGTSEEVYASIDLVVEKLERQVKKYKEKTLKKKRRRGVDKGDAMVEAALEEGAAEASQPGAEALEPAYAQAGEEQEGPRIIRRKQFPMKPMHLDEAAMQMEMLDKNFFVFTNEESGEINVIYRRTDGDFGLIEPTV